MRIEDCNYGNAYGEKCTAGGLTVWSVGVNLESPIRSSLHEFPAALLLTDKQATPSQSDYKSMQL